MDARHRQQQRAHLFEQRRVLQVGVKDVRRQVRESRGDMRRLVEHRTLFEARREALDHEDRDQNSGQQEMRPGRTMCGRHLRTS